MYRTPATRGPMYQDERDHMTGVVYTQAVGDPVWHIRGGSAHGGTLCGIRPAEIVATLTNDHPSTVCTRCLVAFL